MKNNRIIVRVLAVLFVVTIWGCERDTDNLREATFPKNGEVFINSFSPGLQYFPFNGSKATAFDVVTDEVYEGSLGMRIAIPNVQDPEGGYAGGMFFVEGGRDLREYDALTFWGRASQAISVNELGFGLDGDGDFYKATITEVPMNTNWQKYIIPIPNPSKLDQSKGLFYFAESAENDLGYTIWIDEVQYETLGTLAQLRPRIQDGKNETVAAETGDEVKLTRTYVDVNLPNGVDQRVLAATGYFDYSTTDASVANIDEKGTISVLDSGSAVITAKIMDIDAAGSLRVISRGEAIKPPEPAPTPDVSPDSVISLFSNAYEDVLVDSWNTQWQFSTAELQEVQVSGDDIKRYKNLNFVGIEFASQTLDIEEMTHFHLDLWTPDPTDLPTQFKVLLTDFGANGVFDGGDDVSSELTFTEPLLTSESWVNIDIPLSNFSQLTTKSHLAQMVLSGDLPNVFIDNVYFYQSNKVVATMPKEGAPEPTRDSTNVISIFSDAYTSLPNADFNPNWGQATVVTQESVNGNNTLLYTGLNFQGLALAEAVDVTNMTHLHIDYWTANSSLLNTFLISTGPVETGKGLSVPTSGWESLDIALTDFAGVDLADLIQFKFEGNGDIYLDNIYFYTE